MKYSFHKAIQYSKRDLNHYMFSELKTIAQHLDIPVTLSKSDMEWTIAIELLNRSYKSGNMPPETPPKTPIQKSLEWEKGIGVKKKDSPHPVRKTIHKVPATEPETRAGLDDIKWPDLKYSSAARACLQSVMGKHDIWDVEELEELFNDPEEIEKRGLTRMQLIRLYSCLRILKNDATSEDNRIIRRYYNAISKIRKRKRGPPPKVEDDEVAE